MKTAVFGQMFHMEEEQILNNHPTDHPYHTVVMRDNGVLSVIPWSMPMFLERRRGLLF
jgi:hypothetical protein